MSGEPFTVCGWAIPGFGVYVCILPEHDETTLHHPRWLTLEQRAALEVLQRAGRVAHEAIQ